MGRVSGWIWEELVEGDNDQNTLCKILKVLINNSQTGHVAKDDLEFCSSWLHFLSDEAIGIYHGLPMQYQVSLSPDS